MGSKTHVRLITAGSLVCIRTYKSCIALFAPRKRFMGRLAVGCLRGRLPMARFMQMRQSAVMGIARVLHMRLFKGRACELLLGGKSGLQIDLSNCGLLGAQLSL